MATMPYNAASWLVDRHVDGGRGDRLAVICGDRRLRYNDLQTLTWKVQRTLSDCGARPGDRVLLLADDGPAWLAWFLGALRAGVVPVAASTMASAADLQPIVEHAEPALVVASARYCDKVATTVVIEDDDWSDGDGIGAPPVAQTEADSPAFMLCTSGTTGHPRLVLHRHGSLEATARCFAASVLRITPDDRCFSASKLFFAYGLGTSLTFPLGAGATSVLNPSPTTADAIAAVMAAARPTVMAVVPAVAASLLACPSDTLSSVRIATSAGEALPPALHRRFTEHFGVPLLDSLGCTEALNGFLSNRPGRERPGTSGEVVDGYEARVVDQDGHALTEDEAAVGHLEVRGPSLAIGYWQTGGDVTPAVDGDGWLRTGDRYERAADGYWTFLGRSTDLIKQGGIWVAPVEVESVLLEHPTVADVAVIGAIDERGLEQVVAVVVPAPGHRVNAEALEAHCRARMATYKRPRRYVVVDALPRTATGKVRRAVLRERLKCEEAS